MLWCASMPCKLPADNDIPIGQYGSSNVGRAKTVYRHGLAHRYGRRMQTISGIHYNFSLPDDAWPLLQQAESHGGRVDAYRNDAYFALIRNFRRHSWLLLYLFGASPVVCRSFISDQAHRLQELEPGTLFLPNATSLRMSRLGYQSDAQASLAVSYNDLRSYANSLQHALTEPYPPYEAVGIYDGEQYRQLATTLLQIENEFYGTIRPKRRIRSGERPLHALAERGVEYVEVRCMDLDPFWPVGIVPATMRFLDVFLLHCLLSDSPLDSRDEIASISRNQHLVAKEGRDPNIRLTRHGEQLAPAEWGSAVLHECEPIAAALDKAHRSSAYGDVLLAATAALETPAATPSARMLQEMAHSYRKSYLAFVQAQSLRHRRQLLELPLAPEAEVRYTRMAEDSLVAQRQIEAADRVPFETYRREYLVLDFMRDIEL